MNWPGIEPVQVAGAYMRVLSVAPSCRIVSDVVALRFVVEGVGDAVGVIAVLPDGARPIFPDGEGKATFDKADGLFAGEIRT